MTNTATTANAAVPPKLLNLNEACEALRISRWSMYQLINQHRIKTVRIAGRHLITPGDLDAFVARLRTGGEEVTHE